MPRSDKRSSGLAERFRRQLLCGDAGYDWLNGVRAVRYAAGDTIERAAVCQVCLGRALPYLILKI